MTIRYWRATKDRQLRELSLREAFDSQFLGLTDSTGTLNLVRGFRSLTEPPRGGGCELQKY